MKLAELLPFISRQEREELVNKLLTSAYQDEDGAVDMDQEIAGADFVDTFTQAAAPLLAKAEERLTTAKSESFGAIGEGDLDDAIYDATEGEASDLNNSGVEGQITYLIVEKSHDEAGILGAAEIEGPLRGIPE